MTKMTRFLSLIPVVTLAAACSGVAPTGSSQITSNQPFEAVSGDATAMGRPCATLGRIVLNVVNSSVPSTTLWVEATYIHNAAISVPCSAPIWTSDRRDLVLDKMNRMRAGFPRSAGGTAKLTATAANGVHNTIRLVLNPVTQGADSASACRDISSVNVKVLPTPTLTSPVSLLATYVFSASLSGQCTLAPTWTASRKGLVVNAKDPFRASIARSPLSTQVTATAPNGVSGSVTF